MWKSCERTHSTPKGVTMHRLGTNGIEHNLEWHFKNGDPPGMDSLLFSILLTNSTYGMSHTFKTCLIT